MPSPDVLLSVNGLSKRYGDAVVLDAVSFELPAGVLAVVTGRNGAGKSTLLRCLAGLASFTGSATILGTSLPGNLDTRGLLGYLPQDVRFPDSVTVAEVVALFEDLRKATVDGTGLPEGFVPDADARVATLSGGQRQRLATAIALLGGPRLLLLDEPAANLDPWAEGALWQTLEDHRRTGAAVLVATPRADEGHGAPDMVLTLHAGSIQTTDERELMAAGGER